MATTRYEGTLLVDGDEPTNRALLDLLKKINEVSAIADRALSGTLPPIGYVYTQGPDDMSPEDLWPTVTWENVSSEEAGSFRRYEGGAASAFGAGQQLDAFMEHYHEMYYQNISAGGSSGGLAIANNPALNTNLSAGNSIRAATNAGSGAPRVASETRPVNYTVRKWRRTA